MRSVMKDNLGKNYPIKELKLCTKGQLTNGVYSLFWKEEEEEEEEEEEAHSALVDFTMCKNSFE